MIRRFEACARWALGGGLATVPSVMSRVPVLDRGNAVCAPAMCDITGSAAAPAARCKNLRRGSFMLPSLESCACDFTKGNYEISVLLRLNVGRTDHLGPLVGFVRDEFLETVGRAWQDSAAQFAKPCLDARIGKARVDLPVQQGDDVSGRILGRPQAEPKTRFKPRYELAKCRGIRQFFQPRCCGHRKSPQFASPDVLDRGRQSSEEGLHLPSEQIS